jgi:HEAT repeat protein
MLIPSTSITFEAALRDLGSKDGRVRAAAADALGDLPEDTTEDERALATRGLLGRLRDDRFEVRVTAAFSLGTLHAAESVPALIDALRDSSSEVRQAAAISLGRIGGEAAWAGLEATLAEAPPDVRFQAIASLAEIDGPRAYDRVVQAVSDGDPEIRSQAAAILGELGESRAAGWLADLLADPNPGVRFSAARSLGFLGDARGADELVRALADGGDRALDAAEALELARATRAADALAAVLKRFLAPKTLKVRAAAALVAVAPTHAEAERARDYLRLQSQSKAADVRGLAEQALARLSS